LLNLSLAPGFNPVLGEGETKAVSTAWRRNCETSKRLKPFILAPSAITRLKPDAN
jgi:hypothetical protein